MKYLDTLVVVVLLTTTNVATSAENDRYAVSGAGAISCGKWIEGRELRNKDLDNVLIAWMQGFLSGMNTQRFMQTKQEMALIPDPPSLLAYVDKACRDNPLEEVYPIAIRLFRDMQKK